MKKLFLSIYVILISLISYSQINETSPYHDLIIKEKIHYNGDSINGCYVVINDVSINSLKELNAFYMVRVYKDSTTYKKNKNWFLNNVEEINSCVINFTPDFNQGDLFYKVSNELKLYLLNKNKTWKEENILIK